MWHDKIPAWIKWATQVCGLRLGPAEASAWHLSLPGVSLPGSSGPRGCVACAWAQQKHRHGSAPAWVKWAAWVCGLCLGLTEGVHGHHSAPLCSPSPPGTKRSCSALAVLCARMGCAEGLRKACTGASAHAMLRMMPIPGPEHTGREGSALCCNHTARGVQETLACATHSLPHRAQRAT